MSWPRTGDAATDGLANSYLAMSAADSAAPGWVPVVVTAGGIGLGVSLGVVAAVAMRPRLPDLVAPLRRPSRRRRDLDSESGACPGGVPGDVLVGASDGYGGYLGRAVEPGADSAGVVRMALPAARLLRRAGLPTARAVADLRVVDRSPVEHLARAVLAGLVGGLAPALLSVPLALLGIGGLPAWMWLCGALVGFLAPDLDVRGRARRRRLDLRRGTGAVLDLTAICLAGGTGVEHALHAAAGVGDGWAHDTLRGCLNRARTTRTDPWVALGRLGADLGVTELVELSATLALAGTEGARVRASLAAKAATVRAHLQADDEAAAVAATERMSLPVAVLFAGYLVFLGYPALVAVLQL